MAQEPNAAGDTRVTLPATLGIEQAAALHALLAPAVGQPAAVTLAAADIERLHTATLQVLAAFVRTRRDAGRSTAWQGPSLALRQAAARLGLESVLGLSPPPAADQEPQGIPA